MIDSILIKLAKLAEVRNVVNKDIINREDK